MNRSKLPIGFAEQASTIPLLSEADPRELEAVARHTTELTVNPGTVLCREGSLGLEAFIIVSGDADVVVRGATIAGLTAGDVCGEMALLDHGYRAATVIATTPTRLLVMSSGDFRTLLGEAPTFTRRLLATISLRLRDADERIHVEHC